MPSAGTNIAQGMAVTKNQKIKGVIHRMLVTNISMLCSSTDIRYTYLHHVYVYSVPRKESKTPTFEVFLWFHCVMVHTSGTHYMSTYVIFIPSGESHLKKMAVTTTQFCKKPFGTEYSYELRSQNAAEVFKPWVLYAFGTTIVQQLPVISAWQQKIVVCGKCSVLVVKCQNLALEVLYCHHLLLYVLQVHHNCHLTECYYTLQWWKIKLAYSVFH